MKTAQQILGFKEKGRSHGDFYPTPAIAVEGLLSNETFYGEIWEPACGNGAISKVLIKSGYSVYSTDILDYGFGVPNIDFLQENSFTHCHKPFPNIITNPPFNLALDFVRMSKRYAGGKIAMFLKTTFLEGVDRYAMFKDRVFPLKCIYQFSKRISFAGNSGGSGMMSFAWFVWERNHIGEPIIRWIK